MAQQAGGSLDDVILGLLKRTSQWTAPQSLFSTLKAQGTLQRTDTKRGMNQALNRLVKDGKLERQEAPVMHRATGLERTSTDELQQLGQDFGFEVANAAQTVEMNSGRRFLEEIGARGGPFGDTELQVSGGTARSEVEAKVQASHEMLWLISQRFGGTSVGREATRMYGLPLVRHHEIRDMDAYPAPESSTLELKGAGSLPALETWAVKNAHNALTRHATFFVAAFNSIVRNMVPLDDAADIRMVLGVKDGSRICHGVRVPFTGSCPARCREIEAEFKDSTTDLLKQRYGCDWGDAIHVETTLLSIQPKYFRTLITVRLHPLTLPQRLVTEPWGQDPQLCRYRYRNGSTTAWSDPLRSEDVGASV